MLEDVLSGLYCILRGCGAVPADDVSNIIAYVYITHRAID